MIRFEVLEIVVNTERATVLKVQTEVAAALATTIGAEVLKSKESDMGYKTDLIADFHGDARTYA